MADPWIVWVTAEMRPERAKTGPFQRKPFELWICWKPRSGDIYTRIVELFIFNLAKIFIDNTDVKNA